MKFFVDPGEERDGAVVESIAECLRLGALDLVVAAAFGVEPLRTSYAGFFKRGVGGQGMLEC